MIRSFLIIAVVAAVSLPVLSFSGPAHAAATAVKPLPKADMEGGMPLMKALAERKTNREFSDRAVAPETLGNLLWAVWGVNRTDGKHTAPSAMNKQTVAVFVALSDGVWRYNAEKHQLEQVSDADVRAKAGGAPVEVLYAAPADEAGTLLVGSLYQNAGLFCASEGLANVVRSSKVSAVNGLFPLPGGYKVMITQGVGWPK